METSNAPAPPRTPPAAANGVEPRLSAAPAPPAALRPRLLWPALCLFQLGLLAGGIMVWLRTVHQGDQAVDHKAEKSQDEQRTTEVIPVEQIAGELERGDQLLRRASYDAALKVYQPLGLQASNPTSELLQYRVALCLEGLGQFDQALAVYRSVAGKGTTPSATAAADLGQARVWFQMRKPAEARVLLSGLILRSGHPALRDHPLMADVRYLLALAVALEALPTEKPTALDDTLVCHTTMPPPIDRALAWMAKFQEELKPQEDAEDKVDMRRIGAGPQDVLIRARIRQAPVADVLERVAEKSGLSAIWTPEAKKQVAGRSTTLHVDNLPLADVLRCLADPLGLIWGIEGATVHLMCEREARKEALTAYRQQIGRRALREAILAFPGHPLVPAAYLEQGNLEAIDGNLQEALSWFERLVREFNRSPTAIDAYYNMGVLQRRLGDFAEARNSLFQVVDRAPGNELAPLAYLRIGRAYLDEGDAEHAVSPLRRALSSATGSVTPSVAALNLAAAYLLAGNPGAANAALVSKRTLLTEDAFHDATAFLDALAHYRASADNKAARREAPGLLAALLALKKETFVGPAGWVLMGQAYADLGMQEQTIRCYEQLLRETKGPLAAEVSMTLAELLEGADRRPEALKLYVSLADMDGSPVASRARLRLAGTALRERKPKECVAWCRRLLDDPRAAEAPEALRLMGVAYEQLGDHTRAAKCFAGQVPER